LKLGCFKKPRSRVARLQAANVAAQQETTGGGTEVVDHETQDPEYKKEFEADNGLVSGDRRREER